MQLKKRKYKQVFRNQKFLKKLCLSIDKYNIIMILYTCKRKYKKKF